MSPRPRLRPGVQLALGLTTFAVLAAALAFGVRTLPAASQVTPAVRVVAAGDVCDPDPATCRPAADLVAALQPDRLLVLGDNAYPDGSLAQYRASYDPHWGRFLPVTLPVVGNHEARTAGDAGFCAYFGTAAHCPSEQYRVDLGRWSVIVLESNGKPTSAELTQFAGLLDAAAADGDHVLVAWHEARWSSPCSGCHGNGNDGAFWTKAVNRGVDVVVVAHDHKYERVGPMGTSGPDPGGIIQFVSGLGGAHPDVGCASRIAGSQFCAGKGPAAANDTQATDGVLELTLEEASLSWRFWKADAAGVGTVLDQGSAPTR